MTARRSWTLPAINSPIQQRSPTENPAAGLPADLKISSAAVIDPNSTTIKAPTAALLARRVAVLLYQLDPAARVSRAIVPVHVIRGA